MSKILLIGLDATDWEILSTKVVSGELPHLAQLMASGASGSLRSIHPLFSPALWATIATGKRPYEHGITGFTLSDAAGAGLHAYDSTARKVPAIWNMLSHAQKTSHVVGWWNTAPVEKIQGVMVDETFRIARSPSYEPWKIEKNSVFPEKYAELLAKERVHPQELPESLLRALVPKLYEIDPSADLRLAGIAKILAEDLSTLQGTLRLMSEESWDFATPYLIGLDNLSHLGMAYRAQALSGEKERDIELYGEVVDRAYALYDTWIGKLVAAAGKDTTIMIVSDHGFYHDYRRLQSLGIEATAPCAQHAPLGSFIIAGPHIRSGVSLSHASILDICPTLLALFGLPVGKDMPGKVLSEVFKSPSKTTFIASWNQRCPISPSDSLYKPSFQATEAALRQLVALGYLPELPKDHRNVIVDAQCDQLFHRALAYLDDEQFDQAIPLLEKARLQAKQAASERFDILMTLAVSYFLIGKLRHAAANFKQLVRCRRRDTRHALQELELQESIIDTSKKLNYSKSLEIKNLMARSVIDEEAIAFTLALANEIVEHQEAHTSLIFSCAEQRPQDVFMNLHAGLVALSQGSYERGLRFLDNADTACPEEADFLMYKAQHYNGIGDFSQGEAHAREALERNPLHAGSWLALATSLTHQSRWKEARVAARQARKSILRRSKAYELLASIARGENKDRKYILRYHAMAQKAEQYLTQIFHSNLLRKLGRPINAALDSNVEKPQKQSLSKDSTIPTVLNTQTPLESSIVVTGLPRTGTSLLMQMLSAGGLPITTDYRRSADEHNPRGYFEHEDIKSIAKGTYVLTPGEASKVVIPLIWEIPAQLSCYVIFIRRNLTEVIESQRRMAGLLGSTEELKSAYDYYEAKTCEILKERSWHVLTLQHAAVLARPEEAAAAINDFLGGSLNSSAMAAAVMPNLHRVKIGDRR